MGQTSVIRGLKQMITLKKSKFEGEYPTDPKSKAGQNALADIEVLEQAIQYVEQTWRLGKGRKLKVKAMMDTMKSDYVYQLMDQIVKAAKDQGCTFDDSVVEMTITIDAKNITELIGVDEEGCRAFRGFELVVLQE